MTRAQADIIRAGALWGYCKLTRLLAHDPHPLLQEVGLSEADLDNPDHFVSRSAVAALLDLSAGRLDCPDFGLRLAEVQDVHVLGDIAFAVRNARDWRSAVATIVKFVQHHSPMAKMTIGPGRSADEECVVFRHPNAKAGTQLTEHAVGLFCHIDRRLTGGRYPPTRVTFMHAPISSPDLYLKHFGIMPEFGAADVSVSLDQRALSLPLKTANPLLQTIVERHVELKAPAPGPDVDRRVQQAVTQLISSSGDATVGDVSAMLHIHARTLQRRLVAEGTTFKKVRDEVRKHMAETYLTDDAVPLAHVPKLLGYADEDVLTRSCARWFGKTPLCLREQAQAH